MEEIKKHYMNASLSIKLGGLASNLARVESFLENNANRKVVETILEESKYFIEWIIPEASLKTQALLVEIQPNLALWQYFSLKQTGYPKK